MSSYDTSWREAPGLNKFFKTNFERDGGNKSREPIND